MLRSPVVAGYSSQGLWASKEQRPGTFISLKHQLQSQLEWMARVSQYPIYLCVSLLFEARASKLHIIVNELIKHKNVLWKYNEKMTNNRLEPIHHFRSTYSSPSSTNNILSGNNRSIVCIFTVQCFIVSANIGVTPWMLWRSIQLYQANEKHLK